MANTTCGALQVLTALNEAKGAGLPLERFHEEINVIFHDIESEIYNEIHRTMWESLPKEFDRLSKAVLSRLPGFNHKLRLLDIGCGTGLGSCLLLRTQLSRHIESITLLDTSSRMLQAAVARLRNEYMPVNTIKGKVEDLGDSDQQFDVVLTCSVLHHLPDLPLFFRTVNNLQPIGGYFLHVQDPNADADGQVLERRRAELRQRSLRGSALEKFRAFKRRIQRGTRRRLHRLLKHSDTDYMERVNEALLQRSVIRHALTDEEIWMVTDIHDRPGAGISASAMIRMLPHFEPVSLYSYAFFGKLWNELPHELRCRENVLVQSNDRNGDKLGGAWRKVRA